MVEATKASNLVTSVTTCQICNDREASYSCPKCRVHYCSVPCYRNHKEDCVESFYEGRVNQVLQLEVKERKDDMQKILQRIHTDQRTNDPSRFLEEGDEGAHCDEPPVFSEDELKHLWDSIESCTTEEAWEALLRSSPEIQAAMAHMQRDQLENNARLEEWCLESWDPWWMPQLATNDDGEDEDIIALDSTGLDEMILEVPPFDRLCCQTPHPSLPYNLVEILYGIALTLRLFHGIQNSADLPEEAAASLLETSTVLKDGDVYESVEAALFGKRDTAALHDVTVLLGNHRFVARALLEGKTMLQRVKATRRLAKKVEYYLSWSLAHTSIVKQLSGTMDMWLTQHGTVEDTQDVLR